MKGKAKKYLRKGIKILLWIIGSVIGLFLLIVLLIQIPYIQNLVKDKAVSYLEGKIGTDVQIGRIEIGLPKKIIVEGVYFESQQGDTLLAGEKLAVDISLLKLLSNEVEINSIQFEGITANVKRDKDSVFNFDYIIKAFASDEPKDTTSAPMKFSIRKIKLDNIMATYSDATTKNDISAKLTHFDTRIKKFDLDKMEFEVPEINLDGLKVRLEQGMLDEVAVSTQKVAEEASKQPDLKLKLKDIKIANLDIGYDNKDSRMDTKLLLKKMNIEVNEIDLKTQLIDLDNFELENVKGQLAFGKFEKQVQKELPQATAAVQSSQWKFKLANADIQNVNFKFDDNNSAPVTKGIDYKHLDITDLNLEANDLSYAPDAISGEINELRVQDKSGLNLQELRTSFFYGSKGAELKGLYVKTPHTLLKDEVIVAYPSIESLNEDIGSLSVDANIEKSRVGFKDILLFVPTLATTEPFKSNPNATLLIDTRVEGRVNDIRIANLEVSGIGTTVIAASGRIKGLPDVKMAYFDMNVRELRTTEKDINMFVPASTIPANIQLPAALSAKAKFKGTLDNFNTDVNLVSSFGNAKVIAAFDQRKKGSEKYDADAELDNFDLGRLIKNDSIGEISLKAKVKGTGLNPQTATATIAAQLIKAEYNSYIYKDLNVDGSINNGNFEATANMDDPNLDFDLVAEGGFKDKFPNGKIRLNVDIADLNKLNLHAGPLKLRGNVDADIADGNPDNLNGKVSLHRFMFANEKEQFALDSINIIAVSTAERDSIMVKSQFAHAKMVGDYKLTQIGTALSNTIAKYYNSKPSAVKQATDPQQFDFSIKIDNDPIVQKLLPQLTRFEPIDISGGYNSVNDSIALNGNIPRVVYGENIISGAVIKVNTEENKLNYSVIVDQVQNEQFLLSQTNITGDLKDNVLTYKVQILDRKDEEQYLLAGEMKATDGSTELSLNPDGLKLNYEPWDMAVDNVLRFGKDGIYANNFEMSSEAGRLKLQSQSEAPNAPLNAELNNFKIETLTNMIQKEELKFAGTIDGTAEIRDINTKPVFVSDLKIENFSIAKDTIGNIEIKVNNETANVYAANVAITGNDNQVNLDGTFQSATRTFELDIDMQRLNISSIQAFTAGNLSEGKGYLSGNLKVTGTTDAPRVAGDVKFNDVAFRVVPLNSYFNSMNEGITFNEQGVAFIDFSMADEENNELNVNGTVATTTYREFAFNLKVDAEDFRAINSTAKDNDFFYGTLYFDTHLNVRGTLDSPVIDGNLKIDDNTKLTVVLPQQDPSIADREGIVEFVDEDNVEMMERLKIEETVNSTDVKGIDVAVNIEIVKEAELNLLIDKGNGDYLQLKGEAQLTGGMDKSGKTTLTGRYEFTEGAYQMTFNFIKRKFEIQSGSYILWTGEPTEANINISAVYKADIAPIDLVGPQIAGEPQSTQNTFKQKIPFNTILKMEGELLKPELSFDIELEEGNNNVSTNVINTTNAKLAQLRQEPSELNKQVFAVLLLNRFVGENPFATEAGSTTGALARQSVSKILSQQLNNIAGDLIQGVELNFDLESVEDYNTGERQNRTDLNVSASKRLFDDRLKVTVGSNFGVEGEARANEETTNIAGDVAVDYELTKDGRYTVRAYNKDEYDAAVQGQVIETGVSLIFTLDYNKFRELFHRTEEEKEMIRKEKELKEKKKQQEKEEEERKAREEKDNTAPKEEN